MHGRRGCRCGCRGNGLGMRGRGGLVAHDGAALHYGGADTFFHDAWLLLLFQMALHALHAFGRHCTHVILHVGHTRSLEQGHQGLVVHAQIFSHFINTQLDAHPTSDTGLEALNGGALTGPSSATSSVCTSAVVIPSSKIAMTPVSGRPMARPSSSLEPKARALPLFTSASTQGVSAAARASQATSTSMTCPAACASRTAVEPATALRARNAAPISE